MNGSLTKTLNLLLLALLALSSKLQADMQSNKQDANIMDKHLETMIQRTDLFQQLPEISPSSIKSKHHSVVFSPNSQGYLLYIGPLDPYQGGNSISIILDVNYQYLQHSYESLLALPQWELNEEAESK